MTAPVISSNIFLLKKTFQISGFRPSFRQFIFSFCFKNEVYIIYIICYYFYWLILYCLDFILISNFFTIVDSSVIYHFIFYFV